MQCDSVSPTSSQHFLLASPALSLWVSGPSWVCPQDPAPWWHDLGVSKAEESGRHQESQRPASMAPGTLVRAAFSRQSFKRASLPKGKSSFSDAAEPVLLSCPTLIRAHCQQQAATLEASGKALPGACLSRAQESRSKDSHVIVSEPWSA